MVVDNKGGPGGNLAHQFVGHAPADGSVRLLGSVWPLTIGPDLMNGDYDPFKGLAAVSGGVNFANVLVAVSYTRLEVYKRQALGLGGVQSALSQQITRLES